MNVSYSRTAVEICDWLAQPATTGTPETLFAQLNERLVAAETPVFRASFSLMTMHPEVFGKQLVWNRGGAVRVILRSHEMIASSLYQDSPVAKVRRERQKMRIRLETDPEAGRYEVCRELKEAGGTDYLILPVAFRNGAHSFVSWATDRPGGFRDEEIALLEALVSTLSLRFELESTRFATESLLETYLGRSAADRVTSGTFKRGQGASIRAVIWTCDLRGFTRMVDSSPLAEVLEALDHYFACVAAPILGHGGEVLKYIGDAVLGIFPIDGDPAAAARSALEAAAEAFARMAECNAKRAAQGLAPMEFGVALHVGDVMFGNIGTAGRLDFTVIGPAVNEASRVESMCKELGRPLLLTEAFVAASDRSDATSLGQVRLRGVSRDLELFTFAPAQLAAAPA